MGDTLSEFAALMEEFGTSVLQPSAVIGIAVIVILFILEIPKICVIEYLMGEEMCHINLS